MPSAMEECREPSGKCRGISHCLESGHHHPASRSIASIPENWKKASSCLQITLMRTVLNVLIFHNVTLKLFTWTSHSGYSWLCTLAQFLFRRAPAATSNSLSPSPQTKFIFWCFWQETIVSSLLVTYTAITCAAASVYVACQMFIKNILVR